MNYALMKQGPSRNYARWSMQYTLYNTALKEANVQMKDISGAESARIVQQMCIFGYKYQTFSICFQTFLVTKLMQANSSFFSIFNVAIMIFKMTVKFIIIQQIKESP